MTAAVIVGSAFGSRAPAGAESLDARTFDTPYGPAVLHESDDGWLLFRHGLPHRLLPNQIPYRAHAWALAHVGVKSLLVTSSVGVMVDELPLFVPLPVRDIVMLDNRLPDGSACTMFTEPSQDQGHLVLQGGMFSAALQSEVAQLAAAHGVELGPPATFTYVQGPRTKTSAENAALARMGAQVNSMTFAPEVVLANELGISVAGLVVGHKYSIPDRDNPDEGGIEASLDASRAAMERLVFAFLEAAPVVEFANHIYRFGGEE